MTSEEPKGIIPYITSSDGEKHVEWIKNVFKGEVKEILHTDDTKTKIMHCKIVLNEGSLYLADDPKNKSEENKESTPGNVMCHLHISTEEEIDALWKRALEKEAKSMVELAVQFWGDKYGMFVDPFGIQWSVSFPAKEGPPEKMKKTE